MRARYYYDLIEIVNYFTHQYGEHKTLYDFIMLYDLLKRGGFSKIYKTDKKDIDSDAPTRITTSLYIEAVK